MSEAASTSQPVHFILVRPLISCVDKRMHVLDNRHALGERLGFDDIIRAAIEYLKKIGEHENTLIVMTADHGHGVDVFGGVDMKYLAQAVDNRKKRNAVDTYQNSAHSGQFLIDVSSS